jgi:deazaflavin-dependent oxidoreductase (nitroreductase family)
MTGFNQQIIAEFRANDGIVETYGFGDSLIILHTIGARSGALRLIPLKAFPTDEGWLDAASKNGDPDEPAWAHNLRAHPAITVETGVGEVATTAVELRGDERDAAWQRIIAEAPGFAEYEQRTTRTIAVFELVRSAG